MRSYAGRIQEAREFATSRARWCKQDGVIETLFWGELYRRFVPKQIRIENVFAGPRQRKALVKQEVLRPLLRGDRYRPS